MLMKRLLVSKLRLSINKEQPKTLWKVIMEKLDRKLQHCTTKFMKKEKRGKFELDSFISLILRQDQNVKLIERLSGQINKMEETLAIERKVILNSCICLTNFKMRQSTEDLLLKALIDMNKTLKTQITVTIRLIYRLM